MKEMERMISVRRQSPQLARDLFQSTIMANVNAAFISFLFKEVVVQILVLSFALSFIFLGVPVWWCLSFMPVMAVIVYVATYSYHVMKFLEVMNAIPMFCWVAEVHEPLFSVGDPQDFAYVIVNEENYPTGIPSDGNFKRKVIGAVIVMDHRGPFNKLWMSHLSVDPIYRRKGLGTYLTKTVFEFTKSRKCESLDLVITDLQSEARLLFTKLGFKVKSFYHKKIFGFVPFEKYQMSAATGVQTEY